MSSRDRNLSQAEGESDGYQVPDASQFTFAIVCSEWNSAVTAALLKGATDTLIRHGAAKEKIIFQKVPGSFELTLGARLFAERSDVDAVICLGCVIQGETRHFDFICQAVAQGITTLNIEFAKPVIFGVLTTDTKQQALDRAGGKYGNKGDEAALTAIRMAALKKGG